MKRMILMAVLGLTLLCSSGCIGLIAMSAVALDRKMCKARGIEPPKVNPALAPDPKPVDIVPNPVT